MQDGKNSWGIPTLPTDEEIDRSLQAHIEASRQVEASRAAELASLGLPTRLSKSWVANADKLLKKSLATKGSPAAMTVANRRNKK